MAESADSPAESGVEEADALQIALDAGTLRQPVSTGVVGVPDDAAVADSPAVLGVDEADIVQTSIAGGVDVGGQSR
jgi:hypothetical protein